MIGGYPDARALRRALETRLKREAQETGIALARLRKEAAFTCLLRRFVEVAPDSWALKGGVALIWRSGTHLRATKDIDANWRRSAEALESFLTAVEECGLADGFTFTIGDPRPLQGEGTDGAQRLPVQARMDGRTFERFHHDVNVVPGDARPVETVEVLRNPFAFVEQAPLTVPMLPLAQQLAEKLHACLREYRDGSSSRAKDAFDTVVVVSTMAVPTAHHFRQTVQVTFNMRETDVPLRLPPAPNGWEQELQKLLDDYPLDALAKTPEEILAKFASFWNPVLEGSEGHWEAGSWQWRGPG